MYKKLCIKTFAKATKGLLKVTIGFAKATKGLLKVTIGFAKATKGLLKVKRKRLFNRNLC